MNTSACFAFLNWPGTKEAWGTAGESGLGGVSGLWQNFQGNPYLEEEGWPRTP